MTKIQIDDGKSEAVKSATTKKSSKKIIVTEASSVHSTVQKSTTLSRKYVKKPKAISVKEVKTEKVKTKEEAKPVEAKATTIKVERKSEEKSEKAIKKKAETEKKVEAKVEKKAEVRVEKKAEAKVEKKAEAKPEKKIALKATVASRLAEKRLRAEREQAARAAKIAAEKAEKQARAAKLRAEKEAHIARVKAEKLAKKQAKSDRAIRSASTVLTNMQKREQSAKPATPRMEHQFKKKSKAGRIFLALFCSGATVAMLVAFVHFSIPDLSVRVAAIQTGIDAAYPSFVPRGYSLSNVTSDKEGVVIMTFTGPEGVSFTLSEEKSTWDSTALLNNYVKKNYPNDFVTLREQGITIYVRGEKASWVNGGLLYKIDATGKYLTKEQIRNIATSL